MKVNIFNKHVSVFEHVTDKEPKATTTLDKVLTSEKLTARIEAYRETKDKTIKNALPAFTASGVIEGERKDENLVHNGVICLDLDKKDNLHVPNFGDLRQLMQQVPYVAYCGLSVGGEGYFLLIPIKYPERHRQHFKALQSDFKQCGLIVDASCINEGRLRYASSDLGAYFNDFCAVYDKVLIEENRGLKTAQKGIIENTPICSLLNEVKNRGVDITGDYKQWVEIGASIASEYGEAGRDYFHVISQQSDKYKSHETDRKYTECLKMNNFSIGTLYYYAKQYGIEVKSKSTRETIIQSCQLKEASIIPTKKVKMSKSTAILTLGELSKYLSKKEINEVKGEMFDYCRSNGLSTKLNINL